MGIPPKAINRTGGRILARIGTRTVQLSLEDLHGLMFIKLM